ncbi:MAG: YbgC/FadM family acyl-CoA thioesterase [Candidatus Omnitrophota bacterium]
MKFIKRIYYHDTDCGGVVYYANYLKFFEEARTEYLRAKGIDLEKLSRQGILFVVKEVSIGYKAPARYADNLEITTKIEQQKKASLLFLQEAYRDAVLLVTAKTTLVCVNCDFHPIIIPPECSSSLVPE